MANFIDKLDFNGDTQFTGSDIDIAWAYLQMKALKEAGDTSITVDNFLTKIQTQYDLNKSANIAEASDLPVKGTPGRFDLAAKSGAKKVRYEKIWTFNDMFVGTDVTSRPSTIMESIKGERSGVLSGHSWVAKNPIDEDLLTLTGAGSATLDDKETLNNDKSWTIFISGKTAETFSKSSGQVLLEKGGFSLKAYSDKLTVRSSFSDSTYFLYPGGQLGSTSEALTFKNIPLNLFLVKDGIEVNLYLNGERCLKTKEGSQPRLLSKTDTQTQQLVLPGKAWRSLYTVGITDNNFNEMDVVAPDGTYTPNPDEWAVRTDLNLTNSFFAFRQYVQDKYSNFIKFDTTDTKGVLYGGDAQAQKRWTDVPAGGEHFGFDKTDRDKCLNLFWASHPPKTKWRNAPEYLDIPNVNFNSNFTLSFWVRTSRTGETGGGFLRFIPDANPSTFLSFGIRSDGSLCGWQKPGITARNELSDTNALDTGKHIKDEWHHFAFVKNNNLIGTWVNGSFDTWRGGIGFTDTELNDMGNCTIRFIGDKYKSKNLYLADLRFVPYAMSQIPIQKYGRQTSYAFVDKLKARENS